MKLHRKSQVEHLCSWLTCSLIYAHIRRSRFLQDDNIRYNFSIHVVLSIFFISEHRLLSTKIAHESVSDVADLVHANGDYVRHKECILSNLGKPFFFLLPSTHALQNERAGGR